MDTASLATAPAAAIPDSVIRDGLMRKKGSRVNMWGERYFVLRPSGLYYYLKPSDKVRPALL